MRMPGERRACQARQGTPGPADGGPAYAMRRAERRVRIHAGRGVPGSRTDRDYAVAGSVRVGTITPPSICTVSPTMASGSSR